MKEGAGGYAHIIWLRHLSMSLICHSGFPLQAMRTDKRHATHEHLTKFSALFSDFPITQSILQWLLLTPSSLLCVCFIQLNHYEIFKRKLDTISSIHLAVPFPHNGLSHSFNNHTHLHTIPHKTFIHPCLLHSSVQQCTPSSQRPRPLLMDQANQSPVPLFLAPILFSHVTVNYRGKEVFMPRCWT